MAFDICLFGFGNLHANHVQVCIALVLRFVKEKMKLATVLQILLSMPQDTCTFKRLCSYMQALVHSHEVCGGMKLCMRYLQSPNYYVKNLLQGEAKESGLGLDRKIAHYNFTHITEFFGVEFSSFCKK